MGWARGIQFFIIDLVVIFDFFKNVNMNCFNKSKIYIFLNCPWDMQSYEGRTCEGLRVWQMNEETALIWSMALC